MVQMTSLVLMLIRKRPMVVPTTNICGSKKPGTTKYQTRREDENRIAFFKCVYLFVFYHLAKINEDILTSAYFEQLNVELISN